MTSCEFGWFWTPLLSSRNVTKCRTPSQLWRQKAFYPLKTYIARWIDVNKSTEQCLAVDLPLPAFHKTDSVFKQTIRPNIVLYDNSGIAVLELTVCHETNLNKSREYNLSKYKEANKHLQSHFSHTPVQVFTAEISVLGIASDFTPFCDATNLPRLPKDTMAQLSRDAIGCSFDIYKLRNNSVHSN